MTISKYDHNDNYLGQSLYDDLERAKSLADCHHLIDDATGERYETGTVPSYIESQGEIQDYCVNVLGYSGLCDAIDDHAVCPTRLPFYP